VRLLNSPIRPYAWGSRTAIARLQRRPTPTAEPEAELWMGAHPSAPSLLADDGSLTEAIGRDPAATLGPAVAEEFGGRLPYLLKVLAPAEPLSLQAHPNADQARAGFAAEEASCVPRYAASRTYVDPYHKPELLVAVEDFHALCGFRDPDVTASVLESFGVDALKPLIATLQVGSVSHRLRTSVRLLTMLPASERSGLVSAVTDAGRRLAADGGRYGRGEPAAHAHALAADLGRRYPGDVGVVMALLLNQVRLRPDEAIFMPAGTLHAHLQGVGVEIMASSDNVVRGGLTTKHVNITELLRVLRFDVLADPVRQPEVPSPGLLVWRPPVREFALVKATVGAHAEPLALPGTGPRIVVCLGGEAHLRAGEQAMTVRSGESVFVSAAQPSVEVHGDTIVFQGGPH
jgi:mannose-6-phosphate isomerase